MTKEIVETFITELQKLGLDVPLDYVAEECDCTATYVKRICDEKGIEVEQRKYGKLYVNFKKGKKDDKNKRIMQ